MDTPGRIAELERKFGENPRRYFAALANEYRKQGEPERAIELCERHLAEQRNHLSGHVVLAQALVDAGRHDDAWNPLHTALDLDPENFIALRLLGDLCARAGDAGQARAYYFRALEIEPRSEQITEALKSLTPRRDEAPSPPPAQEEALTPPSQPADLRPAWPLEVLPPWGEEAAPADQQRPLDAEAEQAAPIPEVGESDFRDDRELAGEPAESAAASAAAEPSGDFAGETDWFEQSAQAEEPTAEPPSDLVLVPEWDFSAWETPAEPPAGESHTGSAADTAAEAAVDTGADTVGAAADAAADTSGERESLIGEAPPVTSEASEPAPAGSAEVEEPPHEPSVDALWGDVMRLDEPVAAGEPAPASETVAEPEPAPASEVAAVPEPAPVSEATAGPDAVSASEVVATDETRSRPTLVSETMVELYLQQGHEALALQVMRELVEARPDDERLRSRLSELETSAAAPRRETVRDLFARLGRGRQRGGEAAHALAGAFTASPQSAAEGPLAEFFRAAGAAPSDVAEDEALQASLAVLPGDRAADRDSFERWLRELRAE